MADSAFAERVLALADAIPSGCALSYGDVAELLGEQGPRQVGAVLASSGHSVAWHRVIYADGRPPLAHAQAARERWRAEATPTVGGGSRVDMPAARWWPSPTELAAALSSSLEAG